MKIQHILMLSFILGLFGCDRSPKETVTDEAFGPFTIRKIVRTGKSFNANYGVVNGSATRFDVLYDGRPLVPDDLEENTGLPGIWRVFHLADAPKPALLLGSQRLVLVTDEGDDARITPLHAQTSDFASIQWLDIFDGQPGMFRQIFSSDEVDTSLSLSGGRYLAVNGALALDVRTLDIVPFGDGRAKADGYVATTREVLSLAPDTSQVVMLATTAYGFDDPPEPQALVCLSLRGGQPYAVPFSLAGTRLGGLNEATTEWVLDNFQWSPNPSAGWLLTPREFTTTRPRKGRLQYTGHRGYTYTLDGISAGMVQQMLAHIQLTLGLSPDELKLADQAHNRQTGFKVNDVDYLVDYMPASHRLEVRADDNRGRIDDRSSPVWQIGSAFNRLLEEGKYQDLFIQEESGDGGQ